MPECVGRKSEMLLREFVATPRIGWPYSDKVTVSVPRAPDDKKFARLKVTIGTP